MSRNNESSVFSALGHPTRRAVLAYLRDRDYVKVGDIAEAVGVAGSTLSGHLRVLREADLVVSRQRGTQVQYRINLTVIDEAMLLLASLGGALRKPRPGAATAASAGSPAPAPAFPGPPAPGEASHDKETTDDKTTEEET